MKNMFQILQPERALYVQASNCVEEKEWVDLLTKFCQTNKNRLAKYHPCAFINNHWLCCDLTNEFAPGCSEVSRPDSSLHITLDPERDLERTHSLLFSHISRLEALTQMCECQAVYTGEKRLPAIIDDVQSCFKTLKQLREIAFQLEQKHRIYQRSMARDTKYGSK